MNDVPKLRTASPTWLDRRIYPFESRWMDVRGARLHYVDEGRGPVLLMLHGNGSWSFGYRRIIPALSQHFRCIAVDYPGFGLSTAGPGYSFKPADQSAMVEAFVDRLELRGLRLLVQDWGGPIGLGFAGRRPELIGSLVICNTWAWPAQGMKDLERFAKLASGPVGRFLIMRLNFLERVAVPRFGMNRRLTKAERDGYAKPYPSATSRRPQTIFPREILASTDYLADVERGLAKLRDKPAVFLWGDSDGGFKEAELRRFQVLLPNAETTILRHARHFVQEDAPQEMIAAIVAFEHHWRVAR